MLYPPDHNDNPTDVYGRPVRGSCPCKGCETANEMLRSYRESMNRIASAHENLALGLEKIAQEIAQKIAQKIAK